SSVLEPIVLLYNLTKEERYLEFAEYIVGQWEGPEGTMLISKALDDVPVAGRFPHPKNWWSWENGQKAYEMMSCYEGLLELYRATGEETYLEAVKAAVQNIADTEINITGSGSSFECWSGGADRQTEQLAHPMETCVTTTWMKICENLFRLTGDPKYADLIEQSGYNALISAMKPDGSTFAKYTALTGTRKTGGNQCGMNINCCVANGPRGMMILPRIAVMTSSDGPVINLYCEGTAVVPLSEGHKVKIVQKTGYPVSDAAEIKIYPEKKTEFTLFLRIPQWSERSSVRINGKDSGTVIPGTYVKISRNWKAGDTVTIKFDLRGRVVRSPGDKHIHNAIVRGPIVLARDSRLGEIDTDEVLMPLSKDGFIKLEEVAGNKPENILMVYKAPFSVGFELRGDYKKPVELLLCDFSSAGNTWDRKSRYRVWLPQHLNPAGESKY
ncbi:glycoside hydrolase family 127 protein, partial [bacterium]|nr:glycoside hydrolase family 127 protein [bacterium]